MPYLDVKFKSNGSISKLPHCRLPSASDSATNPLEGVVPPGLGRVKSSLSIMNRVLAFYTIVILNTSLISGIGSDDNKRPSVVQCDQETPFA
jgi:hypothetical protein